jgi:hypothetical protein
VLTVQGGGLARFAAKARGESRIGRVLLEDLDRDLLAKLEVRSLDDQGPFALANDSAESVLSIEHPVLRDHETMLPVRYPFWPNALIGSAAVLQVQTTVCKSGRPALTPSEREE